MMMRPLCRSFILMAVFVIIIPSARPSQSLHRPRDQANDKFESAFSKLDQEEQIHQSLDEGMERWETRCVRNGGQKALDNWLKAQEDLIYCAMSNFDWQHIQEEIASKKSSGDLDLVFKKYCGKPIEHTRPCVHNFLEVSSHCLQTKDKDGISITMNMFDAAVDFMCQNHGDRIALFLAEEGLGCVERHRVRILDCLNASLPDMFNGTESRTNWIVFDRQHCRKGDLIRNCVESELLKCDDPTPSNIVNSLLLAMRNATPCRNMASASFMSARASGSLLLTASAASLWFTFSSNLTVGLLLLRSVGATL